MMTDGIDKFCYHCGIDFENEKSGEQEIRIVLLDGEDSSRLRFHPSCFHEIAGSEYYDELLDRRNKEIIKRETKQYIKGKSQITVDANIKLPTPCNKCHRGYPMYSGGLCLPCYNESLQAYANICRDCKAPSKQAYCKDCTDKRLKVWGKW
jgi:hypothetical protein